MIDPGQFIHRLTPKWDAVGVNATTFEQTKTPTTGTTFYGLVKPMAGAERLRAERLEPLQRYLVTYPKNAEVQRTRRLVWEDEGLTLEVVSVANPDGRGVVYEAVCTEKQ